MEYTGRYIRMKKSPVAMNIALSIFISIGVKAKKYDTIHTITIVSMAIITPKIQKHFLCGLYCVILEMPFLFYFYYIINYMSNSRKVEKVLSEINNLVWGKPLLVLLLGTGIIYTVKLKFFQVRSFPYIVKNTFLSLFGDKSKTKCSEKGSISQIQSVCASLAAAMGTGNIAGVATAITIGGAGSVFWMWISAIVGMALVYSENYLGVVYRRRIDGKWYGGPMAYLEYGTNKRILAVLFAIFCAFASFGMGNMTQVNSISSALCECFEVPPIVTGIVVAVLCFVVISGGISRIGKATQVLIPILSAVYMLAAIIVIAFNFDRIPSVFYVILTDAFGIDSIGGGISGTMVAKSINVGLRRGVFSNEAGLGSSAVLHSSSDCRDPKQQGMWAVFEVFVDTIVCCTLTALVILTTCVAESGRDGILLVTSAFSTVFGFAPYFIAVSIALFAFATIIGWFHCGECAVTYILGERGVLYYKLLFIGYIVLGAVMELESVWLVSDIFNGFMAFPNLAGLLMLRKKVKF